MSLKQGDLFWGMDSDFVKQVMDESEKTNFEENSLIFNQGETADFFYILLKGRVKLTIDGKNQVVYIAKDAGQVIGWSSLIGRTTYSATAKCVEPVTILKIEKNSFLEKLSEVPKSEAMLFKRVAEMLGERLLSLYPSLT